MYAVEVKGIKQSEYTSYSDAVNQASLVQGRVVGPHPGVIDDDAHLYAVSKQGFSGDYAEWQRQDDVSRDAFASEVSYRICRGRGIPGRPARPEQRL